MKTTKSILTLNSGSSSLKFSIYLIDENQLKLKSVGQIEGIGVKPTFKVKDPAGSVLAENKWTDESSTQHRHDFFMNYLMTWLHDEHLQGVQIVGAGHRVVHGGSQYKEALKINSEILETLEKLNPLAPLHQPHNLSAIKMLAKISPELPQVACFDTAFHQTAPEILTPFFIPEDLRKEGVRRYGFHGLSYEYIAKNLAQHHETIANKKTIVAHLGSGASLCAIENGKSVITSMGLTALDGIPMGTRPGALDAGVVLYLLDHKKMNSTEISNLLYKKSGLLGLSGISNDMRELEQSTAPEAAYTIEAYAWKIVQMMGQLAYSLQGFENLVFTAGIGENSVVLREKICSKLSWLGLKIDLEKNNHARSLMNEKGVEISTPDSKIRVLVIPTNEELMIAQHCWEVVKG